MLENVPMLFQCLPQIFLWMVSSSGHVHYLTYSQLELPIWDSPVKVDIVRMKDFSEGNLININECTAWVFVRYYRQVGPIIFWEWVLGSQKIIYYVICEMVQRYTQHIWDPSNAERFNSLLKDACDQTGTIGRPLGQRNIPILGQKPQCWWPGLRVANWFVVRIGMAGPSFGVLV